MKPYYDHDGITIYHGDWIVVPFVDATIVASEVDSSCYGTKICDVHGREEHLANARLIAAAPKLLAALEAMMSVQDCLTDCWCSDGVNPCEACMARAAISEAKGTP